MRDTLHRLRLLGTLLLVACTLLLFTGAAVTLWEDARAIQAQRAAEQALAQATRATLIIPQPAPTYIGSALVVGSILCALCGFAVFGCHRSLRLSLSGSFLNDRRHRKALIRHLQELDAEEEAEAAPVESFKALLREAARGTR